jgi:hypothetical protein
MILEKNVPKVKEVSIEDFYNVKFGATKKDDSSDSDSSSDEFDYNQGNYIKINSYKMEEEKVE